jgi:hypothetical protein
MKLYKTENWGQFYVIPTIKITYDRFLNGDYEVIFCFLKWEFVIAL